MELTAIMRTPPLTISPGTSVMKAVEIMHKNGVGAVAVIEDDAVTGIFTERDLLERVVLERLSTMDTEIRQVMTKDPYTVTPGQMDPREAFEFMTEKHLRHLPVVDDRKNILGMLSVRHLMRVIVLHLHEELGFLNAYIAA